MLSSGAEADIYGAGTPHPECGNCEQQHKVEGFQKGTRPIIAGHPLSQNDNSKPI